MGQLIQARSTPPGIHKAVTAHRPTSVDSRRRYKPRSRQIASSETTSPATMGRLFVRSFCRYRMLTSNRVAVTEGRGAPCRNTREGSLWRCAHRRRRLEKTRAGHQPPLVPLPFSSTGCLVQRTNSKKARSQNKRGPHSHTHKRRSSLFSPTSTPAHALSSKSKTKGRSLKSAATLASVHESRTTPGELTASPALRRCWV